MSVVRPLPSFSPKRTPGHFVGVFRVMFGCQCPRSSWVLLWLLLTGFTGVVRFVLRDLLLNLRSTQHKHQLRVVIYGAGEAGVQLAAALRLAGNHRIVTFLDDNPTYWRRFINGVPICPLSL